MGPLWKRRKEGTHSFSIFPLLSQVPSRYWGLGKVTHLARSGTRIRTWLCGSWTRLVRSVASTLLFAFIPEAAVGNTQRWPLFLMLRACP